MYCSGRHNFVPPKYLTQPPRRQRDRHSFDVCGDDHAHLPHVRGQPEGQDRGQHGADVARRVAIHDCREPADNYQDNSEDDAQCDRRPPQ